jgi:hypothetical protein
MLKKYMSNFKESALLALKNSNQLNINLDFLFQAVIVEFFNVF